jgi:glycosyltransferase involved in cell wall biosynthesis
MLGEVASECAPARGRPAGLLNRSVRDEQQPPHTHIVSRMRLTVDLRFQGSVIAPVPGERVLTLGELAGMVRTPGQLRRLLRAPELDELCVLRDDRALTGVQSGALALAALGSAERLEVRSPTITTSHGRRATRMRAMTELASALPVELARSALWHERARRAAARSYVLPARPPGDIREVTYLRAEPSLRWLGAQVGGAATHTSGVINALTNSGIDVNVFAPERPEGVREAHCHVVPPRHILQLVYWLTLVGHGRSLVSEAIGRNADLIYQRYALGSYAGLELARALNVPLVLEFNGSEIWTERHWGSGRVPLAKTLAALERRNLLDASLIVVVSRALKDSLMEAGIDPGRVLINPNGVDLRELEGAREHPPAYWRLVEDLPPALTVGFVGTFGLWHGVRLLPELIDRVSAHREDARWVLVGDGPLHAEVVADIKRRGLSNRVLITGVVSHSRAVKLLSCCDVCVSPHVPNPDGTAFFGSPTKLFEYMGLARAIVASDLEQIGEVLEDGRTALLTPAADVAAVAGAVVRLLDDEGLRGRLGQGALQAALANHSWDKHVERILRALEGASVS